MISQAAINYPDGTFRILDLQSVSGLEKESFGGAFCIGNVLPHLPSRQLPDFLQSMRSLMQPGGRWIFQTVNFDPLLHLEEYIFPVLSFPDDGLTFHRKYTSTPQGSLLFQTRLMQGQSELFVGEADLYPRQSSDYLTLNRAADFKLLGHFADFSGKDFIPKNLSGSVYVFEVPGAVK